ncbi:MAG TPA: hypothetical protein VFF69_08770 [Phycisphaerales bacterium]|nr:hypothetical protein [Phycisphaerales bacterium]
MSRRVDGSVVPSGGTGRRPRHVPAWLVRLSIPLLLWAFTTVVFGLDIGRVGDDHAATTRRPETGELLYVFPPARHYLHKPFDADEGEFWRPLYMPWIVASNTLLWNHTRWLNLLDAALYLGVGGALYALMRALRIGPAASLVATALFLVYPAHSQVVYWKAASGTTIAVGLLLVAFLGSVAYVRRARPWPILPGLAGLGFAVPAFNEQPAPALAAIPLMMLAARRPEMTRRAVALRTATVTVCVGAACGLYGAMLLISGRAAYEPYSLGELPARAAHMIGDLLAALALQEFAGPALDAGLRAMGAAPVRSALALGALAGAFVPWARRVVHDAAAGGDGQERPRRGWVAGAAGAGLALTLPAVILIRLYPWWDSRFLLAPAALLAILAAAGLDALLARMQAREGGRAASAAMCAGLAPALAIMALMMVGAQEPYRDRAAADVAQAAQLRRALPDPDPGTFFMPLSVADADMPEHGWRWYALGRYSVWHWPWSVRKFLCTEFARSDIRVGFASPGLARVLGVEEEGLRYSTIGPDGRPYRRHPAGGFLVPWELVAPFRVREDGVVELVTELVLPDGRLVAAGALRESAEAGRIPRRRAALVGTGGGSE